MGLLGAELGILRRDRTWTSEAAAYREPYAFNASATIWDTVRLLCAARTLSWTTCSFGRCTFNLVSCFEAFSGTCRDRFLGWFMSRAMHGRMPDQVRMSLWTQKRSDAQTTWHLRDTSALANDGKERRFRPPSWYDCDLVPPKLLDVTLVSLMHEGARLFIEPLDDREHFRSMQILQGKAADSVAASHFSMLDARDVFLKRASSAINIYCLSIGFELIAREQCELVDRTDDVQDLTLEGAFGTTGQTTTLNYCRARRRAHLFLDVWGSAASDLRRCGACGRARKSSRR
jgi:hypothetical protein